MEQTQKHGQIKSGIILSYAFVFVSFAINFIYTPILTNNLGQNHYGTYSLIISIVSYLEILNNGMASTYIKFAAKYFNKDDEELANINGLIVKICIIFAIIAIIAGVILIFSLQNIFKNFSDLEIKEMKVMLSIMLVNVTIVTISSLFESYIVLNEKFVFQKILLICKKVLLPVITIPLLIIGFKGIMVVTITTVINLVALILNTRYCKKKLNLKIKFAKTEKRVIKDIFIFYIFMLLTVIIDQINWNIDSIIIGIKRNAKEVAIYSIAAQINAIYMTIATTVAGVFTPRIHFIVNQEKNDTEKNNEILELITKVGRIQCMTIFLILFGFIFFGKQFIILLFGKEYELAYIAAVLLITPISFVIIKGNILEVYRAKDKQKVRTIIYFIIAVINIIASYNACEKYGIVGCTVGTTISIIIGHIIIFNIYDHNVLKINMFKFWKEILKIIPAFIIPIILGVIIHAKVNLENIYIYMISMIIFTIVYAVNIYILALNKDEREAIQTVNLKIKNIFHKKCR